LNPSRDPSGVTAMVAAKLLRELISRMVEPMPGAGRPSPEDSEEN